MDVLAPGEPLSAPAKLEVLDLALARFRELVARAGPSERIVLSLSADVGQGQSLALTIDCTDAHGSRREELKLKVRK